MGHMTFHGIKRLTFGRMLIINIASVTIFATKTLLRINFKNFSFNAKWCGWNITLSCGKIFQKSYYQIKSHLTLRASKSCIGSADWYSSYGVINDTCTKQARALKFLN